MRVVPVPDTRGGEIDMDADVLVVGAGPTGLMLANQLVRRGVRTRIIDRHSGPSLQTRALGVQARTLEIYAQLGIVSEAIELGKRATGANMWAAGRRTARVPLGDIGKDLSPYPFVLILGQDDNERLLGDALRKSGLSIEWNTELVGLTQTADQVSAQLKHPDGSIRDATISWVAGCDGARSAVRELSAIPFEGAPYEHVFFVADTVMTGPMVPDELNIYFWRDGFHLFFPMRGTDHWRIVGIVPPELRGRGRSDARRRDTVDPRGSRGRRDAAEVQLVFHLPDPSPPGPALPGPPLFPPGRRGSHPQSGGRAGDEHRPPGCVQPGLEAGARRSGPSRCRPARLLRGRSGFPWPGGC